jgi:hypothetical protein
VLRLRYRTSDHDTFHILLRSVAPENKRGSRAKLRPNHDLYGRETLRVCAGALPANTRDESCLVQIKEWLYTCFHTHRLCHRVLEQGVSRTMPSRLIYIGADGPARLVCSDDRAGAFAGVQYVSLSHRWQPQSMPTLVVSNLEQYKEFIDFADFPPVFRDAVEVSRWLGVRYIWIDALCIVQDDKEDWRKEAAKMGRVYENAIYNLGGHAAADVEGAGLFLDRDPRRVSLYPFTIRRAGFMRSYYGYPMDLYDYELNSSTLLHRGWVFQERLLSPRSIYFGHRIQWECSELQASETYPEGGPAISTTSPWSHSGTPFRVSNLLSNEDSYQRTCEYWTKWRAKSIKDVDKWELHRKWLFLVESFSVCRLTYEQDRFPALAGLALYFEAKLGDEYFAGLWKTNLISGLLWIHDQKVEGCHLEELSGEH